MHLMKKLLTIVVASFTLFLSPLMRLEAQNKAPLRLIKTIPMPNVKGRLDHMDVDVEDKRLFVAGLENGSVEVVDLQAAKWVKSIRGFKKPQGIAYVKSLNKLFVASGDDGMLRIFRGDTLELLDSIKLDLGPNRVAYDPQTKRFMWATAARTRARTMARLESSTAKRTSILATLRWTRTPRNFCWTSPEQLCSCFFPR